MDSNQGVSLAHIQPPGPRRVVLTGPESSGKTTLAEQLAVHFDTHCVPEFARSWIADKLARGAGPCVLADVLAIARGQSALESQGAQAARHGLLICDTDVPTIRIWSECFFGATPPELETAHPGCQRDLYLLTDIDIPWIADGLRDRPENRERQLALFHSRLTAQGCRYVLVSGNHESRLCRAVEAIESWLASIT